MNFSDSTLIPQTVRKEGNLQGILSARTFTRGDKRPKSRYLQCFVSVRQRRDRNLRRPDSNLSVFTFGDHVGQVGRLLLRLQLRFLGRARVRRRLEHPVVRLDVGLRPVGDRRERVDRGGSSQQRDDPTALASPLVFAVGAGNTETNKTFKN